MQKFNLLHIGKKGYIPYIHYILSKKTAEPHSVEVGISLIKNQIVQYLYLTPLLFVSISI